MSDGVTRGAPRPPRPPPAPPAHPYPLVLSVLRACAFYFCTYLMLVPLISLMTLAWPWVIVRDRYRRGVMHRINEFWAKVSLLPFTSVSVLGAERLPGRGGGSGPGSSRGDGPVVYVANHASALDIYTLLQVLPDFKFIARSATFRVPLVGWAMRLTGHVKLRRGDARSHATCLRQCGLLLSRGASVLFFPEGTRSSDGRVAEGSFKRGAFSVAARASVPVIPITIKGTQWLMPARREFELRTGAIQLVVHEPIVGKSAEESTLEAEAIIRRELGDDLGEGKPLDDGGCSREEAAEGAVAPALAAAAAAGSPSAAGPGAARKPNPEDAPPESGPREVSSASTAPAQPLGATAMPHFESSSVPAPPRGPFAVCEPASPPPAEPLLRRGRPPSPRGRAHAS